MKSKIVGGISMLMLLILVVVQPGYSQDATPTPVIEVAPEMEGVPENCGILAEPIAIDPLIPQAIGASPIWVALPNTTQENRGILVVPDQHDHHYPPLEGWWATKVAFFVSAAYPGEVQITGFNVADDSPMYFAFGGNEPTELAILNPAQPGGFVSDLEKWAFFPSHLWVSKAGCYRLEAVWEGGLWQQIIAVGS